MVVNNVQSVLVDLNICIQVDLCVVGVQDFLCESLIDLCCQNIVQVVCFVFCQISRVDCVEFYDGDVLVICDGCNVVEIYVKDGFNQCCGYVWNEIVMGDIGFLQYSYVEGNDIGVCGYLRYIICCQRLQCIVNGLCVLCGFDIGCCICKWCWRGFGFVIQMDCKDVVVCKVFDCWKVVFGDLDCLCVEFFVIGDVFG